MGKRTLLVFAGLLSASCSSSVDAICDEALQEFYRCGGIPQSDDFAACVDGYESAPYACDRAFRDRLDCTYGVACDAEDQACNGELSAEYDYCGGVPIVPPY